MTAIYRILQYPDPKLKRKGRHVTAVDDHIKSILENMFATHYAADNCAALAATQLDMPDPPHITVIHLEGEKDQPMCLINGEIIEREGEMLEEEACMSVRGVYDKVKRSHKIKVRALDREGKQQEFTCEGYLAKCIQHELDHLNGMIYLDRLSQLRRLRIEKKLKKIRP